MNKKYISIRYFSIFILPFILMMCMSIENITHPDNPQVNSEIEIKVDLKLEPGNDDQTKMIFAILAPKSWNIANKAVLTFTTSGYTKGDVVNEPMNLVALTDKEPTTQWGWPLALENSIGLMGNLGPVEWVVFESKTTFNITDETEKLIKANVKIKLTTGSENMKVSMGYFFCGKNKGLNTNYYKANAKSKVLRITGGTNDLIDYTTNARAIFGEPGGYNVYTVQNVSSQYFMGVSGDVLFNEKYKDKALAVQDESTMDYEFQPDKWFRWYFIYKKTEGGIRYFQLMNAMSGKYLAVSGGAVSEGLPVQQLAALNDDREEEQLWQIMEVSDGKYKIVNKKTNLALTVGSNNKNAAIMQAAYSGADAQLWKLYPYELCSYRDEKVVRFFERNDNSSGSTAFDQGSSIPLANGKVLWITQDAWDGFELTANNLFSANNFFYYGNSMFLQPSKDNWNPTDAVNITRTNSAQNKPRQICDIQPNQSFAWPSNGVELKEKVYLNCGEGNGLAAEGQSIYEIWPDQGNNWNVVRHLIPSIARYSKITYSAGMIPANDGYVYVYGARIDITRYRLYVARFSQDDPINSWTFWNGNSWTAAPPANDTELNAASILEGIGASVAVAKVNGKYIVMSLDQGFWATDEHFIRMATSSSPNKGFSAQLRVYDICENIYGTQARYYTPNIHPVFTNGHNELLVTYSLNYSVNEQQDVTVNEKGEKVVNGATITNGGYIDPYFYRIKGVRVPYSLLGIPEDNVSSGTNAKHSYDSNINVYPNPVEKFLCFQSDFDISGNRFNIYNFNGSLINSGILTSKMLDVSMLSEGIYILKVSGQNGEVTQKFLKRKAD